MAFEKSHCYQHVNKNENKQQQDLNDAPQLCAHLRSYLKKEDEEEEEAFVQRALALWLHFNSEKFLPSACRLGCNFPIFLRTTALRTEAEQQHDEPHDLSAARGGVLQRKDRERNFLNHPNNCSDEAGPQRRGSDLPSQYY